MTISPLHHRHSLRSRSIASFLLFAGAFGVALLLPGSLSAQMPGGGGASLRFTMPLHPLAFSPYSGLFPARRGIFRMSLYMC